MKKYICDVCGYVYDPVVGDPDSGIEQPLRTSQRIGYALFVESVKTISLWRNKTYSALLIQT